ncbi:hypothetical protein B0H13DRAFT_2286489 [Mycena leptocephala]|nr:hypothetical protein B0H13DRAFT_2286489 [Mycena leptocephala]
MHLKPTQNVFIRRPFSIELCVEYRLTIGIDEVIIRLWSTSSGAWHTCGAADRRSSSTEFSANSGSSSQKVMNPAFLRRSWARSATMAVFPAISSWQYTSDADFGIILPISTRDPRVSQAPKVECIMSFSDSSTPQSPLPAPSAPNGRLSLEIHPNGRFKLTFRTKYRSHRNLTLALFSPILNSGDLPDIQYCSFCFAGTIQLPLPDLRRERRGHPGLAPGDTADL